MATDPPNSIDLPEDTPVPEATRRQSKPTLKEWPPYKLPNVEVFEKPPQSVGHKVQVTARQALPSSRLQWVVAVATIVTAMGGGAGIREFLGHHQMPLPPPAMTTDQATALIAKVDTLTAVVEAANSNRVEYSWAVYDALEARAKIQDGLLCRLNRGKSFARRVNCDAIPSGDWESVPLGKEFVGPFKVTYDWPAIPLPPDPRP